MTTILKLTGVKASVNPLTNGIVVKKGETAAFDDNIAEKLKAGKRIDKEGNDVFYWEEQDKGVTPTHDFSTKKAAPAKAAPKAEEDEDAPADAATATPKAKPAQRRAKAA